MAEDLIALGSEVPLEIKAGVTPATDNALTPPLDTPAPSEIANIMALHEGVGR